MKKMLLLILTVLTLTTVSQSAQAQTAAGNPWDGPRFSSIKAEQAVWKWIETNGYMPDLNVDGEWVRTEWTYVGKSTWMVVISWGTDWYNVQLGTTTILVKNNGSITEL